MKVSILDDWFGTLQTLPSFERLTAHDVTVWTDHVDSVDVLAERLADTEALVLIRERTEIRAALLDRLAHLRLISQRSVFPHIDVETCILVRGARDYGEPGILVTFEESAAKVTANVASLGFDFGALQADGRLIIHTFRVDPTEIIESGDFDLAPLFLMSRTMRRSGPRSLASGPRSALPSTMSGPAPRTSVISRSCSPTS